MIFLKHIIGRFEAVVLHFSKLVNTLLGCFKYSFVRKYNGVSRREEAKPGSGSPKTG